MDTNSLVALPTYNRLNFFNFSSILNWSASAILVNRLDYRDDFKFVKIGKLIHRVKDTVKIQDDIIYQRVTIRVQGRGVTERDREIGKNIGTKNQFRVSAGQFIMSKIDARNGAFGIVPKELEGAAVTQDFLTYSFNTNLLVPEFFVLLTTTKQFYDLCQRASSGTTNRQRIDEQLFLNFEIPVPSLEEQMKLVEAYNDKVLEAERLESEIIELSKERESYFIDSLQLLPIEKKEKNRFFQIYSYSELQRWDIFSMDNEIYKGLKNSKYSIITIGQVYKFVHRGWNKNKEKENTFNYVELGDIDFVKNIIASKKIEIAKAPSRATQIIYTNDLIIGTTRPYLKRFAIVTDEYNGYVCSSGFSVITPSETYNLEFLKLFLLSTYGIEQLKNKMSGALYPAITESSLKEIFIPFPKIEIQNQIVAHINKIDAKILNNGKIAQLNRTQALENFENALFNSKK